MTRLELLRALPKSLRFNLRYFGLREGLRLPVLVSHRVVLSRLRGTVTLEGARRFGLVRIGFGDIEIFDRRRSRSVWFVEGDVVFRGAAQIGHGSKVEVKGTLVVGDRFWISAETEILCHRRIVFGDGVLIAWDVLVMDTDHHVLVRADGRPGEREGPIEIGDDVWIGCRATILKGVRLGDGCVVAAGSLVHRSFEEPRVLIGGNPARALREGVEWRP